MPENSSSNYPDRQGWRAAREATLMAAGWSEDDAFAESGTGYDLAKLKGEPLPVDVPPPPPPPSRQPRTNGGAVSPPPPASRPTSAKIADLPSASSGHPASSAWGQTDSTPANGFGFGPQPIPDTPPGPGQGEWGPPGTPNADPKRDRAQAQTRAQTEGEAQRLERKQIIPAWQVALNIENTDIVKGIVPKRGLGLIVGKYGSAKSFFALHLASCMSRGVEFFGRKVERCGVVYIAAESGGTFDRRIVAHHFDKSAALGFIFSSIDFGKPIKVRCQ